MRPSLSRLRSVIFDLDGLLVDSEPLQLRAYQEAFLAHGLKLGDHEWQSWHALGASVAAWLAHNNLDADPEAIRATKKSIYEELIRTELKFKPGAAELVLDLHSAGVRLAVASSSRIESIEACLELGCLRNCFHGLYSATTTPRKKPHPDVFKLAMADMKLSPTQTIVLEDSLSGLKAATAANLRCVVCPDSFLAYDPSEYEGAALIVSSLEDLSPESLDEILHDQARAKGH